MSEPSQDSSILTSRRLRRRAGQSLERPPAARARGVLARLDRRGWTLAALICWGVLLCAAQLLLLRASPDTAEGGGYLCTAGVHAALLAGCWMIAQNVSVNMRLRWRLMAIGSGFGALAYLVAAIARLHFVSFAVGGANMTWLFDTREALMLLAVLRVSRARQQLVTLDIAQAMLFVGLRFALTYWPSGENMLANNHLIVTMIVSSFFVVMAWTASRGAVDEEEFWSLQMFTLLFAARAVQLFFADAIAYLWLQQLHGSAWDVVGTVCNLALAIYLIRWALLKHPHRAQAARLHPSLLVRSLMPSFLVLGNILLALLALERSKWYTVFGVGAATCWYALQVALVQHQALQQSVKLHSRNRELEHIASCDPLTKAGNRHSLSLAFTRMRQQDTARRFAILLADADCFKQANDCHGHPYGDQVLIRIAACLEAVASARPESHCGRIGGDEFAVLLADADASTALAAAEQVRHAVEAMSLPAGERSITLSIGVTAMQMSHAVDLASALAEADIALYEAKSLGRNRVALRAVDFPPAHALADSADCAVAEINPAPLSLRAETA